MEKRNQSKVYTRTHEKHQQGQFKVTNVNDLDLVYSILRESYPNQQIKVIYNHNTKEYIVNLTNEAYNFDPEVPVDLNIEVVYGDSVTGDTPLLLRDPLSHQVTVKTIGELCTEWNDYPEFKLFDTAVRLEKQYGNVNLEVWSSKGWNPIKKVIRHKTDKQIFRVLTHTGVVDVTEDHSLLTNDNIKIKPKEVKIGDSLLHSFPQEFNQNENSVVELVLDKTKQKCIKCSKDKYISLHFHKNRKSKTGHLSVCKDCSYFSKSSYPLRNIDKDFNRDDYILSKEEAKCWGFFMGDGSCGMYKCKSGIKNSWALNNNNFQRLEYFKSLLEKFEPVTFKILDTLDSSGVYKLVPKGSIRYMVSKYRNLFYDVKDANKEGDKLKVVPSIILNADNNIKKAFWEGYFEADGSKTCGNDVCNPKFTIKGKIGAMGMYYLLRSIGFNIGINVLENENKQQYYYLSNTNFKSKNEIQIKKIFPIENDISQFVYDLETECGQFHAGVGQLVVSNTDSVFIAFKYNRNDFRQNRLDTFNLATICGEKLTDEIFNRPPIEMEFEKVFQPFILLTKKRYIANKYENPKDPFQLKGVDAKGIALTRRDYCKMVKDCYRDIIDTIVNGQLTTSNENDDVLVKSLKVFKEYIEKIDKYNLPFDDLGVSAMLAKSYKSDNLPHVNLAKKLKERKEDVQVGDRIPYIFVETGNPKAKKSELAEDPKYAAQNGLKFNRLCYLEQLAKPILGFYKVVLKDNEDLLDGIITHVNEKIKSYGGKPLKPSDFKIE